MKDGFVRTIHYENGIGDTKVVAKERGTFVGIAMVKVSLESLKSGQLIRGV